MQAMRINAIFNNNEYKLCQHPSHLMVTDFFTYFMYLKFITVFNNLTRTS